MFTPDDNLMAYLMLHQLNESVRGYEDPQDSLDDDTESLNDLFRKYTQ